MAAETDRTRPRTEGFESIPIRIVVRVAGARCRLDRLTRLSSGEVIQLDRGVGEPFDLLASGVPLARVEPVALDDQVAMKLVSVAEGDSHGD